MAHNSESPSELPSRKLSLTDEQKTMKLSISEGTFAGLSQTLVDNSITPFALILGGTSFQIGIMNSIAGFILPLGQIWGSKLMVKHPRKKLLGLFALFQSFMFIITAGLGLSYLLEFNPAGIPYIFMGFVFLINIFGGVIGPSWISLMGDIIPEDRRGRYFSKRSIIITLISLISATSLAFLLNWLDARQYALTGFISIFSFAFLIRLISSMLLFKHYEPPRRFSDSDHITLIKFTKNLKKENFGIFTFFMVLIAFAQWVAGPFFGIYMLKILEFDYATYIGMNLSASFVSLFVLPIFGKIADKFGNRLLLKFGATLIPIPPILWAIFKTPLSLLLSGQLLSGIGWTAFNFAASNFIYDNIPSSRRGESLAYYSLLVGFGSIIGGICGSILMAILPFDLVSNYKTIFVISGILRGIVVIILIPKIKEMRATTKFIVSARNQPIFKWLMELRLRNRPKNGKKSLRSKSVKPPDDAHVGLN